MEADLKQLSQALLNITVEAALNAELDDQILYLYVKGMSTRDIVDCFQGMNGADISPALVSNVTKAVLERVTEGDNRP